MARPRNQEFLTRYRRARARTCARTRRASAPTERLSREFAPLSSRFRAEDYGMLQRRLSPTCGCRHPERSPARSLFARFVRGAGRSRRIPLRVSALPDAAGRRDSSTAWPDVPMKPERTAKSSGHSAQNDDTTTGCARKGRMLLSLAGAFLRAYQ